MAQIICNYRHTNLQTTCNSGNNFIKLEGMSRKDALGKCKAAVELNIDDVTKEDDYYVQITKSDNQERTCRIFGKYWTCNWICRRFKQMKEWKKKLCNKDSWSCRDSDTVVKLRCTMGKYI